MAIRGVAAVTKQAGRGLRSWLARPATQLQPILVNGAAGVLVIVRGQPMTLIGFSVAGGKIVEIDAIADPERLRAVAGVVLAEEETL